MPTLDVVSAENQKTGSVDLSSVVFEAPVKQHMIQAEVRRQLAKRRAGTHSTKNRAAVSGGGSKPWRQKGTGRARQGTTRAPQWAGGGVVFGPVPRTYEHALNKKFRRGALRAALSHHVKEGAVTVVDEFGLEGFKTKRVAEILGTLGLGEGKVLIVTDQEDQKLERSARNLPKVSVLRVAGLNVFDVLRHKHLVITRSAVAAIEARLGDSDAPSASKQEA